MFSAEDELAILRQFIAEEESNSDGERICLRTRAEFVDEVFYQSGQAVGAQIVGFNLPFDLSRLAIRHASARRSMKGGFSLTLSEELAAGRRQAPLAAGGADPVHRRQTRDRDHGGRGIGR